MGLDFFHSIEPDSPFQHWMLVFYSVTVTTSVQRWSIQSALQHQTSFSDFQTHFIHISAKLFLKILWGVIWQKLFKKLCWSIWWKLFLYSLRQNLPHFSVFQCPVAFVHAFSLKNSRSTVLWLFRCLLGKLTFWCSKFQRNIQHFCHATNKAFAIIQIDLLRVS